MASSHGSRFLRPFEVALELPQITIQAKENMMIRNRKAKKEMRLVADPSAQQQPLCQSEDQSEQPHSKKGVFVSSTSETGVELQDAPPQLVETSESEVDDRGVLEKDKEFNEPYDWDEYLRTNDPANGPGRVKFVFDIERRDFSGLLIPVELEDAGLTQEEWNTWIQKLTEIQHLKWTKSCTQCGSSLMLSVWFLIVPFSVFIRREGMMNKKWSDALLQWQKDFNEQCLKRHGIYCKTQSYGYPKSCNECMVIGDGVFDRWIAFAVTPSAIERLKREPHIFGRAANWRCCCHVPDSELCMHPEYHMEWKPPVGGGYYVC